MWGQSAMKSTSSSGGEGAASGDEIDMQVWNERVLSARHSAR